MVDNIVNQKTGTGRGSVTEVGLTVRFSLSADQSVLIAGQRAHCAAFSPLNLFASPPPNLPPSEVKPGRREL